jgi:hypothetical protein
MSRIPHDADYVPDDAIDVGHGLAVFPSPARPDVWEVGTTRGWGIGAGLYWETREDAERFAHRIAPLADWTAHPSDLATTDLRERLTEDASRSPGLVATDPPSV